MPDNELQSMLRGCFIIILAIVIFLLVLVLFPVLIIVFAVMYLLTGRNYIHIVKKTGFPGTGGNFTGQDNKTVKVISSEETPDATEETDDRVYEVKAEIVDEDES